MLPLLNDDYWEKISERELGNDKRPVIIIFDFSRKLNVHHRDETLFEVASELEQIAISLSSTLEGYNIRVGAIRDDIKALSDLKRWDKDDDEFEDPQDIIRCLRECSRTSSRQRDKEAKRSYGVRNII
jgi:hypothetical protein